MDEAVRTYLDVARVVRFATVSADGTPHVVPVCPILDGDVLVFASGNGAKVRNVRANPSVCFVADDYVEDWPFLRQVVAWGSASVVEGDDPRYGPWREAILRKFPQYPSVGGIQPEDTVLIATRIERVAADQVGA